MSSFSADTLKAWLVGRLAALRGIEAGTIDVKERFNRYGLDSLGAGRLIADLSEFLGRPLSPNLVWEAPTIEALVRHLTTGPESLAASHDAPRAPAAGEPIAIVGMACRFPGAPDPEAFWRLLRDAVEAISEVPRDRWDAAALYDSNSAAPGKVSTRWGGFLDQVDQFDPQFFGISPREAVQMDPQQRLTLELAWEALEDAGIPPYGLAESRTGVFVGALFTDYSLVRDRAGAEAITTHSSTGGAASIIANRVSYAFGLQGPSLTVDTASSSSLVAVHLACQSLRSGESDLALAGGVNLMLVPETTMGLTKLGTQSPDGTVRTFDAGANGYVRGEGAGIVTLKRLSDALRDGDRVYAVVRGTAVNNDGASDGLTAPNPKAQQAVLRSACASAGIAPGDVHYVEAHGTGTPLGDPIEASALGVVYGAAHPADRPLLIGSVKPNVGHLEAAAGVVGLVKVALAMTHDLLPQNLHFETPNPRIDFDGLHLRVVAEPTAWPVPEGEPRRAGVSSFGYGGTNCHVVVESSPRPLRDALGAHGAHAGPAGEDRVYFLPVSGKVEEARRESARRLAETIERAPDLSLDDLCYTAGARRAHHRVRATVVAQGRAELLDGLRAVAEGEEHASTQIGASPIGDAPKVVFVFSGQGSQWVGMGRQLIAQQPVFRAKIEECDVLLRRHLPWSLLDELAAPEERSRLGETEVVQPALFAIQVGLAALLESWGVRPDGVIGHSIGEVAAAHVAGALSIEEATRLVAWRGRIMQKATGLGKMAWVGLPPEQAAKAIAHHEGILAIAAVNDPGSVVLSGETTALGDVVATLAQRGVECRPLHVNYAFHSPQMDPLARELTEALGAVQAKSATMALYSTVTGASITGETLDAAYWGRNVRAPVQFANAVASALGDGHQILLEVGPHPVLSRNLAECVAASGKDGAVLRTLRRQSDEHVAMLHALGGLHVRGVGVDFRPLHPAGSRCVSLPAYPWQRERYWIEEGPVSRARSGTAQSDGAHPLLGASFVPAAHPESHYWEQRVGVSALPYLDDHRVNGEVAFPSAGYVEMALAAATEVYGEGGFVLEDVAFDWTPSGGSARRVQVSLVEEQDHASIVVASQDEVSHKWTTHAVATLRGVDDDTDHGSEVPQRVRERCSSEVEGAAHYARMQARQLQYGPAFQGVDRIWVGEGEALARVRLPVEAGDARLYQVHPALLDACLQVAVELSGASPGETVVPAGLGRVRLRGRPLREVWVRVAVAESPRAGGLPALNISMVNERGLPLLEIDGLRWNRLVSASAPDPLAGCAYTIVWQRKQISEETTPSVPPSLRRGPWVILGDDGGTGAQVARHLRALGQTCVEVIAGSRFARSGTSRYTIDPSKSEDYQRLFREVVSGDTPCQGVVHFWSLDATPWGHTTDETLLADVRRGTMSALHVVQELVRRGARDAPRLVLVTRGAQAAGGDALLVSGSQAPLWGLGRTIAMEQPDLACTRVDLASEGTSGEATQLVRELLFSDGEDQIALRSEGRLVARLERGDLEPAEPPALDPEASYLITGGLGGLGLTAARWMVSRGARHLVLLGRSEPSSAAMEAIRAMEEAGAHVRAWQADVSRASEVAGALEHIEKDMPVLRGIVHAAGVVEDRTLQEMGEEQFFQPIRPKILGAWNLHEGTRGLPLDFFVMFSSSSALLGSPSQGNNAAANAFLDALAHVRTAEGLPAMSVQWGPFSDVGLSAPKENRGQRLAHRGIDSLTSSEGTELFCRLLRRPCIEVGLLRMSVRLWTEFYPRAAAAPFLADLREEEGRLSANGPISQLRESLQDLPVKERRSALERHVRECLGHVFHIAPNRIDPHVPFKGYGLDSLMSLEIRNRLEPGLGLKLPAALLYTYPTTAALVEHLLAELHIEVVEQEESLNGAGQSAQQLSEALAVAMLDARLNDLENYLK